MGRWGFGIFENDTACDFKYLVVDGGGLVPIEQARMDALILVLTIEENSLIPADEAVRRMINEPLSDLRRHGLDDGASGSARHKGEVLAGRWAGDWSAARRISLQNRSTEHRGELGGKSLLRDFASRRDPTREL